MTTKSVLSGFLGAALLFSVSGIPAGINSAQASATSTPAIIATASLQTDEEIMEMLDALIDALEELTEAIEEL